jgi:hypothetical protein
MVHTNRHNVLSEEIRDESVYLITRCDPKCMGWDWDWGHVTKHSSIADRLTGWTSEFYAALCGVARLRA